MTTSIIKMKHSKFLLFPELSSGEDGEEGYINFNDALLTSPVAGRSDDNSNISESVQGEKRKGLEKALDSLKQVIIDVNKTLDNWDNHK